MNDFIRLDRISSKGDSLFYEFSSSLRLFKKKSFRIDYPGRPVPPDAEGMLEVPFAAAMAPVAFAAGADLEMPALDERFAESLESCREYWRVLFPSWKLTTRIRATRTHTRSSPSRDGLLFSGGIDSLSTYAHHRKSRPELFVIFGADIPYAETRFIEECKAKIFAPFAAGENVPLTYISTDIRRVFDYGRLTHFAKGWYPSVQFALLLTALTAPVSFRSVRRLLIASCSHEPGFISACGGAPAIVRSLGWAGTRVEDDLPELDRVGKVSAYLRESPDLCRYLRVCWAQHGKINCGQCRKCLRTICELLLAGIDPAGANFPIQDRTLADLRKFLEKRFHLFFYRHQGELEFWRAIRKRALGGCPQDLYGCSEFFEWIAHFDRLAQAEPQWTRRLRFGWEKAVQSARKRPPFNS